MKKILALLIILAVAFTIIGCETAEAKDESMHPTFTNGNMRVEIDKETGVNYIVYYDYVKTGCGAGVCPRYNADGTLYVSEVE